jgi:hypothetical protein
MTHPYQVSAPDLRSSPYEAGKPVTSKIEQARYEMIKSTVRGPEVVHAPYMPTQSEMTMSQPTITQVEALDPQAPVVLSTSMRELQPLGPRYYGYPPPTRSPYAK